MKKHLRTIIWAAIICAAPIIILDTLGFNVVLQPTGSMAKGLYRILPPEHIHKGDIVIFKFPKSVSHMRSRMWAPSMGVTLMKPVQGVFKDQITITTDSLYINDMYFGKVETHDRHGLPLPVFEGRHVINRDYLFVASTHLNSFDSRYFGLIHKSAILGIAKPIFTLKEE